VEVAVAGAPLEAIILPRRFADADVARSHVDDLGVELEQAPLLRTPDAHFLERAALASHLQVAQLERLSQDAPLDDEVGALDPALRGRRGRRAAVLGPAEGELRGREEGHACAGGQRASDVCGERYRH
jgi:hypothetical protein